MTKNHTKLISKITLIVSIITISFSLLLLAACGSTKQEEGLSPEELALKQELEEEARLEKKHPTKVVWEAKNAEDGKFVTVLDSECDNISNANYVGNAPRIDFEKGIDLSGYNYLNFEFCCPDDTCHSIGVMAFAFDPNEKAAFVETIGTKEYKTLQSTFGVNHGEWPTWENGSLTVKPNTNNRLNRIFIYAWDPYDDSIGNIAGVNVQLKKITATNIKLRNNPEKDYVIFKSVEPEGHKFTTNDNWGGSGSYLSLGESDLENYKYVNFEFYSPNSDFYLINIDGMSGGYRTGVITENIIQSDAALSKSTEIQQFPFGQFKGYWNKWEDGKNVRMPVTDNLLHGVIFNAVDMNNDWNQVGGVDIYVKSITATNKKLENDKTKDRVIFDAEKPEYGLIVTEVGHSFHFPLYKDLEGYAYLNIELYSPNSGLNEVNFNFHNHQADELVADLSTLLTPEPQIIQIPFGKNHDYDDWSTGKRVIKQNTTNYVERFYIYAKSQSNADVGDVKVYIKNITATNKKLEIDPNKDKIIYYDAEPQKHKISSYTNGDWAWLKTGKVNLEGYKYLNIELYSTDSGNNLVNFSGRYRDGEVASLKSTLTKTPQIIQIPFGKGNGYWNEWPDGKKTSYLYESSILDDFGIWSEDEKGNRKANDIYVKSITATNKSLNAPDKDKVVYKAPEAEGHKITTIDGWQWLPVPKMNLEEYKYLNFEVYSPNSNNYSVCLLPRDHAGDIGIADTLLTKKPQIIQIPFGKGKGTYDNWDSGEKVVTPYASSCLWDLAVWARDEESLNGWPNVEGIDVYVKSITATNKKIENDLKKDKVVYTSPEAEGHKITTTDGWRTLATGRQDLEGYKYLNVELSSPNSGSYLVGMSVRDDNAEAGSMKTLLTKKSKIVQIPFGVGQGTYDNWDTGKKVVTPYASNILYNICFWATETESWNNTAGVDIYVKSVTATNKKFENDPTKDKVIFESSDSKGYKIITKDNNWEGITIGDWDLEGYKYVNIEVYNPNDDYYLIEIDGWGKGERVFDAPVKLMPKGVVVIQSLFGTANEYWYDWVDNKSVKKKSTTNYIDGVPINLYTIVDYTETTGVEFYVKRIVATNKKLEEPKAKEKVVFEAPDSKGYKLTTGKEWKSFNIGDQNLEGYKYINIELYSPNCGENKIDLDGWGGGERIADFEPTVISGNTQIIQHLFGTSNEYWDGWVDGEWKKQAPTSDIISSFGFSAHNPDNWDEFAEGVDIYIKRIWGTNTQVK